MEQNNPIHHSNTEGPTPLQRGVRKGALGVVAFMVASMAVWGLLVGLPGVYGVALGAAIGAFFVAATAISMMLTADASPATTGAVVLGGWLLKIIVLLVVLFAIRNLTFYHHVAMFVSTVGAMVIMLASEVLGVVRSQTPYVDA